MSELTDSIVAAFADNVYPGDTRLTVHGDCPLEYDETRRLLIGRSWQDFPAAEFIMGDTPFPDLSPEALHYYMPALLLATLDPTLDVNSDIAHSVAVVVTGNGEWVLCVTVAVVLIIITPAVVVVVRI